MPDPFNQVTHLAQEQLDFWVENLEQRAAQPALRAMLDAYLAEVAFPSQARVLEVGCGTGPITRVLAAQPSVTHAVGVDPSPAFIAKAREFARGIANLSFEQGDGYALPFPDASFEVVVLHTTLIHVADPLRMLCEAFRVLDADGWLAVFDSDAISRTVATGPFDPLQACIEQNVVETFTHPWLVRQLPALVNTAGFHAMPLRTYGYAETTEPGYMAAFVDRGADLLVQAGRIGTELAAALKAEARRRMTAGTNFHYGTFASLIARKPPE